MLHHTPIKFLLVDDLEANLVALEGLLKREGLELLKAHSGREALELLLLHEVALAFVDVQMPEMSGFELAEIMRSTEKTRGTPIIFLTAGTVDQARRIQGYESGAIDFLPKPIDPTLLLNKAGVFYELARQRQDLLESERMLRDSNLQLEQSNAKLERADRSKDEFLAMLAHELRNPLAPVLTGVEVLTRSPHDPELVGRIGGMMQRQIGHMARLIDDLLDVSRITNGKIELQKREVCLREVVSQAVESVQPLIEKLQHELSVEEPPGDLSIVADPHRLTQVISNLLSNAAKYTAPGGKIHLALRELPGDRLRISVKDNGRGISEEHKKNIFNLFDQGASGPQDGLGIGLTLVKSLLEMHGGTILAESEGPGKGSEFIMELPGLIRSTTSAPVSEILIAPKKALRVLVADDGKSTADVLGMFFQMEGSETRVVYDGQEAIAEANRFQPDLACFDLGMPIVDGYEAARQVRKSLPGTYIVALSGWGSNEDRLRTAAAGFDEHLVKPVSPADLRALLDRTTSKRGG